MEPPLSFTHLKRLVTIPTVLRARGLDHALQRQGTRLVGPCPVHGGDNPRAFVVDLNRNLWHCFTQCHGGGDVVELVRRLDRIGYRQTAQALAELAQAPGAPCWRGKADRGGDPTTSDFQPFTRPLPLQHDTAWLQQKGIQAKTALRFETGAYQARGFLEGCIALRLHNPQGHPLGYAGRRLNPARAAQHGKWKFPPKLPKSSLLYGYHRLPPLSQRVVIVEGPWGVMRLYQLGIAAIALLGTQLSSQHLQSLQPFARIALLLDGDAAGRSATQRLHHVLSQRTDARINPFILPQNLDPDDLADQALIQTLQPFLS